jgi:hypothetical protein
MNYIIGMCKDEKNWISDLKKHGYEVQIIEQKIHCVKDNSSVKPDLIVVSNSFSHAIVFELKGGKTIKKEQLDRYANLTPDDLRYVTVYDRKRLQMDVSLCDFEENHADIKKVNNDIFPVLIFNEGVELKKENNFKFEELNKIFNAPISLKEKTPPTHYYPFSEDDDDTYIALHVIRAMISLLQRNVKKRKYDNLREFKDSLIKFDDNVAKNFIYIWDALSEAQKKILKNKIEVVTQGIFADTKLTGSLEILHSKEGHRTAGQLEQFTTLAMNFIKGKLTADKGQVRLTEFTQEQKDLI